MPLLVRHAEPLLLVHDQQTQILERHVVAQQGRCVPMTKSMLPFASPTARRSCWARVWKRESMATVIEKLQADL